ncbi:MAG TPA: hypothetical protein ENL06_02285, partial [Candidatus Portnoybacteria bacterium]|nr:hypothetical protein [Candidatus Portnoybacteria bacterium]
SQINAEQTQNFAETQKDAEMKATRGHSLRRSEATGKGMTLGSAEENRGLLSFLHKTIKGVTEDIEELKFNTAISKLMIFINTATAFGSHRLMQNERRTSQNTAAPSQNFAETQKDAEMEATRGHSLRRSEATGKGMTLGSAEEIMEKFLILLSPFAPFLSEKLWQQLGHQDSIFDQQWPKYDSDLIKDELITMVIQINGKMRDSIKVSADIAEKEARELALSREKIKKWIGNQKIKKVIFVKGRLVNIVF